MATANLGKVALAMLGLLAFQNRDKIADFLKTKQGEGGAEGGGLLDQLSQGVSGTALGDIVESIKQVVDIVSEIATASGEQASGIEEVNKALVRMDEATQQNSALVEENAATAQALRHQAAEMTGRVDFFQLEARAGQRAA